MAAKTMTERLRIQLAKNLEIQVKEHGAPSALVGEEFLDILLDLLLGLFEQCLGQNSKETVSGRVSKPNWFQRSALRRKIRRNIFENSRRRYNGEGGDAVYKACLQTAADASDTDADDMVDEVDDEGLIDYSVF